jgi:hypothetical protein
MTLFNPIDPRRQVVSRVQKPTKPVRRYTAAESKALEDHYIACMEVLRATGAHKKPSNIKHKVGGPSTGLGNKVLAHIHGRWMTAAEIAKDLGVDKTYVFNALSTLKQNGYTNVDGLGRDAKHFGLQKETRKAKQAREAAERCDFIMSKVKEPMVIGDIREATGFSAKVTRNSVMRLVDHGKLVRVNANGENSFPCVKYLYAPAEGGAV